MIELAIRFPAGRYHANPWGHHVNEGQVAWPPDPWRLFRALIAVWRRKLDPAGGELRASVEVLLAHLAQAPPSYHLPPGMPFHTRHYMPVRDGKKEKPVLIFDAGLHMADGTPLRIHWPAELDAGQRELLARLVENLGYLGRAESWTEASLTEAPAGTPEPNCRPLDGGSLVDEATGEVLGERIELLVPRTPEDYVRFREGALATATQLRPKARRALERTLPESWLDALMVDSADLQAAGWSMPPAARSCGYFRPPVETAKDAPRVTRRSSPVTTLRFTLAARPLPPLEETVRVGEWARTAAMARAGFLLGRQALPWQISGHQVPRGNRHGHAFYLPEDVDGDGRIDHLLIHVPAGLDAASERVLRTLRYLKDDEGEIIELLFEGVGQAGLFAATTPLAERARIWQSATPYLHPWHLKLKGRWQGEERTRRAWEQVQAQVRRECRERGLPEPSTIRQLPELTVAGRPLRPVHFRRFRRKSGLVQPDRLGRFLELEFEQPVQGPLALGFGCHFGLGLFRAAHPV